MTTSTTAIADTIPVATSTGSMGAFHTGLGVYEYGFSMCGNTLGVSTHREPLSYSLWGFPEHGGFLASYTGTGNQGKPGKMGRHFPVRERSGNFVKTGKVREFYSKYWKNLKKLYWKIEKNT